MDLFQYIVRLQQEMHRALAWQSDRIKVLTQELAAVRTQLEHLERLPRTNIEKIEYSFEQLKVERLDGTLIIGISPADTGVIQDFDMGQQHQEDVSFGQTNSSDDPQQPIRKEAGAYIREQVPKLLEKEANARSLALAPKDRDLIVEDMLKQVDERIRVYFQHMQAEKGQPIQIREQVFHKVKQDVDAALQRYVEHFGKGEER